jgi:hypothetical protein
LDPKRAKLRSDMLLESVMCERILRSEAQRVLETTDKLEPSLMNSRKLSDDPTSANDRTESAEPRRATLLIESDDEQAMCWMIDNDSPTRAWPTKDKPEPHLKKFRSEIELPTVQKLRIETCEP